MRLMPRTRFGVAWRAVVALVIIVGCSAGATATAGLLQVKQVVNDLNITKALSSKQLTPPTPSQPQTLLLVGVDCRGSQCSSGPNGLTDTMMLVRIDDSSSTINQLSIPRDLGVQIPGYGYSKINAAYTEGGATLLIKTLRADVFPDLRVNHVLVVDFASFANLINAIGCVYADVDHRYYNYNDGTAATDYSSIDIEPGYQKLCGGSGSDLGGPKTALAFVRFRHNDSDLVRESRQQAFLRWAKQGISATELLAKKDTLLKYFGEDVQTDSYLHSTDGVDELFNLAWNADGTQTKSIPFPYAGSDGGNLTFDETQAEQKYQEFMTPTTAPTQSTTTTATPPASTAAKGSRSKRAAKPTTPTVPEGLVADPKDGQSQASGLGTIHMPVYYPANIPEGFGYCFSVTGNCSEGYAATVYTDTYPRNYLIDGSDNRRYPSYVFTLVRESGGYTEMGTGEFFTVQGTTWRDPPILRKPSETKNVDGKWLYEYSQGGALTVVAWKTSTGVYWISNTLQNNIPNDQMVAMAASFTHATP